MPLEDHLLPGENIRFQSSNNVKFGDQNYRVIVTNKRIILYAQRGAIFKRDDVVTIKLDEVQGIKYKEKGILSKTGIIEVHGKTLFALQGPADAMKALYQQLLQFI